jgi:hypothetical protein
MLNSARTRSIAAPPGIWLTILLAIALIAAFQVKTLSHREIIHYDEAYYLCEARGLTDLFKAIPQLCLHPRSFGDWKVRVRQEGAILPPGNGKPSFILIMSLAALLPFRAVEIGGLVSLAGCLAAVLFYFACCRKLGLDPIPSGLLTLLFLCSPLWEYYAISTYANPLAAAILLIGIYFYLDDRPALACLTFGFSFTVHYSTIVTAGILFLALAWERWNQEGNLTQRMRPLFAWGLCALAPFLVWQIAYLVGQTLFKNHLTDVVYRTYWEQLTYNLGRVSGTGGLRWAGTLKRNLEIIKALASTETWPVSIALGGAVAVSLAFWRRLSWPERGIVASATIGVLFWFFNRGTVVSRATVPVLPPLYLTLAIALGKAPRLSGSARILTGTVMAGLIVIASIQIVRNGRTLQSPFKSVLNAFQARNYRGQVLDSNWPIWQFYLQERMAARPEDALATLDNLHAVIRNTIERNPAHAIPLVLVNGELFGEEPRFRAFFDRLLKRQPDGEWSMPFAALPVYQKEFAGWMDTSQSVYHRSQVSLFWIDAAEARRLFHAEKS